MAIAAKATIRLELNSQKEVDTLLDALKPEMNSPPTHRSIVKLEKAGNCLILAAEAEDTVALRATLNAYLRWIHSSLNVLEIVKNA